MWSVFSGFGNEGADDNRGTNSTEGTVDDGATDDVDGPTDDNDGSTDDDDGPTDDDNGPVDDDDGPTDDDGDVTDDNGGTGNDEVSGNSAPAADDGKVLGESDVEATPLMHARLAGDDGKKSSERMQE